MLPHRSLTATWLLVALAACVDAPTDAEHREPIEKPIKVVGVYEFTLTDGGAGQMSASARPVSGGPNLVLNPVTGGISFETLTSSSFTEGVRGQGGSRYI